MLANIYCNPLIFPLKYNIPKKEEAPVFVMPELSEGTINAKKKSPAELAISTEDDGNLNFLQKEKSEMKFICFQIICFKDI